MQPDDELCLCFHITRRKLENYVRVQRPRRAAQLSECLGAGTGCGWCRPFLVQLFDTATRQRKAAEGVRGMDELAPEEYARQRDAYRAAVDQGATDSPEWG